MRDHNKFSKGTNSLNSKSWKQKKKKENWLSSKFEIHISAKTKSLVILKQVIKLDHKSMTYLKSKEVTMMETQVAPDHDLARPRLCLKVLLVSKCKNIMNRKWDVKSYRNKCIKRKLRLRRKVWWRTSIKWRSYKNLKPLY